MASIIKASGQTANHIYHFVFFLSKVTLSIKSFVELIFRCQNTQDRLFGCGVLTCSRLRAGGSLVCKSSFLFLCLSQGSGCCSADHCRLIISLQPQVRIQTSPADICCSLPRPPAPREQLCGQTDKLRQHCVIL